MNAITDPAAGIVAEVAAPVKKTCSKCGAEKVLEEFHLDKKGGFGRQRWCKVCFRKWWQTCRQRPGVMSRHRAYARAYRERPRIKERQRAYWQSLEYKKRRQAYWQSLEYKKRKRAYVRGRHRSDPAFRLKGNLRTRLRQALKGTYKSARTLELLGCTVEELRAHLEAQFKPGMTWENQSFHGWHVDHIRPCASFDLTDPEQQRICFHYTNLQPLWATENLSKGAKLLDTAPAA